MAESLEIEDYGLIPEVESTRDVDVEEDLGVRLSHAIDLKELVEGHGTTYEIMPPGQATAAMDKIYDDMDAKEMYKYHDPATMGGEDSGSDDDVSPFEMMVKDMTDVTGDNGVLKRVLQQGTGGKLPEKAFVKVHYNAYLEYADEPFDSTWMQSKPQSFTLGYGQVIQGMEIAVTTMKKGEMARFLIKPEYAYGPLGCPPRIEPNATVMFQIELLGYMDHAGVGEFYAMPRSERKQAGFDLIQKVAEAEKTEAKELFETGLYRKAINSYKRAIQALEDCHLQNEAEEKGQEQLLLKLRLNMSLVNLKLCEYDRAINYANDALEIEPKNIKALYLKGKAFRRLGNFECAQTCLRDAYRRKPNDPEINEELNNLERNMKELTREQKKIFEPMFRSLTKGQNELKSAVQIDSNPNLADDFRNLVAEQLQHFVDDPDLLEMPFPQNLTKEEQNCIAGIAQGLGLSVREMGEGNSKHYRVVKPG